MKRFLVVLMLLCAVSVNAAITGPFPVGPGADPLPAAVAAIVRFDVVLSPAPYVIVTVAQFVSSTAYAAGVSVGQVSWDMSAADFQTYVLGPVFSGVLKTYQSGIEDWLIAVKLPGWSKL